MFRDLIGKPYEDLGRGPDSYDCWGVVIEVGKRLGIEIPDYQMIPKNFAEVVDKYKEVEKDYRLVPMGLQRAGDIVMYKRYGGGLHFGVMIDERTMLHSSQSLLGIHAVRLDHPILTRLVKGIYRVC